MPGTSKPSGAVYPRVCGGTGLARPCWCARQGLSPRVRGNPEQGPRVRFDVRSIPACAGEPGAVAVAGIAPGVYPRVCGGTTLLSLPVRVPPGLSPRVRGNLLGLTISG